MESLPYILPIIMLLFAIGMAVTAKMLSLKSIAGGCATGFLMLFLIGCAAYLMVISSGFESKLAAKDLEIATMQEWRYQHMDEMSLIIGQQRTPDDKHLALLKQLNSYGWHIDNQAIKRLTDAHTALEALKTENNNTRTRYLIKGVPNAVDRKLVELGLRRIGFRIVPFKEQDDVPANANALYFGQNVDIESVKMAALTLMQAGIEIKMIKPFPKPTRGNVRAIKIEWSKYAETRYPLSASAIVKSKGFK